MQWCQLFDPCTATGIQPDSSEGEVVGFPDHRLKQQEHPMAKNETKAFTAHVPKPLADRVVELAARLERSHSWVITQALSAWLDQADKHDQLTLEALAEVDAGRVIDHQEIQAWVDSLDTDHPLPAPTIS